MHKWKRRKDHRPLEILLAALDLFVKNGFSATKINDIAAQANVSKGTVYLYYESKESLFKSMVYELMIPKISEVENYIEQYQGKQVDLLHFVIQKWWQTAKEEGLVGIPKLILSEANNFPDVAQFYVKEVIHRIQAILVNILESGYLQGEFRKVDKVLTSRVILSSLVYFSMWDTTLKKYDHGALNVEELIQQQVDIIINGIKN